MALASRSPRSRPGVSRPRGRGRWAGEGTTAPRQVRPVGLASSTDPNVTPERNTLQHSRLLFRGSAAMRAVQSVHLRCASVYDGDLISLDQFRPRTARQQSVTTRSAPDVRIPKVGPNTS